MRKQKILQKLAVVIFAAALLCALTACNTQPAPGADAAQAAEDGGGTEAATVEGNVATLANDFAEDEEMLIATYAEKFTQLSFTDAETGLSIDYNLFLPENYGETLSYPMVVFIGDSTCAGDDPTVSLTQGRGALVWASDEWQSVYPTIVAVPSYPETILDDHDGYATTDYVELTKRYIDYMTEEYAADPERVYGTGQSMGCMTTLILASEHPGLYAACMFVDGQWDVGALKGLENQPFVYFAAEDDTSAWSGSQEVQAMFDADSVPYAYAQWDGSWTPDELSAAADNLFTPGTDKYFISWASGTIETGNFSMGGGSGGSGIREHSAEMRGNGGAGGGSMPGSVAYHMASFDYAYRCIAVMEWLFAQ